jgi:hypothetical protein
MTDDDKIAKTIRERLGEVAALVDGAAPAPPRREWAESRLRPVAGVRPSGARRSRSTFRMALAAAVVIVLAGAVILSWNLRERGVAVATGSSSPRPTLSTVPYKPTGSPVVATASPNCRSGWPMDAQCMTDGAILFAPDGSLFSGPSGANRQITAFDASGQPRPGWPIAAPVDMAGWAVAPDGSLLVGTATGIDDFELSGQMRPGWPVDLAGAGVCNFVVQPSGAILVFKLPSAQDDGWVHELTLTGDAPLVWSTHIPGGYSSEAVAQDGTIYLTRAVAGTASNHLPPTKFVVSALGSDGKLISGWSPSIWDGMAVTPAGDLAVVAYDTTITTTGMEDFNVTRTHVAVLDRSGKPLPGWPRTIDGPASAPAVGLDGSVYLVRGFGVATGSVLAFDSSGRVKAGWPVSLPSGYVAMVGYMGPDTTDVALPPIVANGLVYVAAEAQTGGALAISAFPTSGNPNGWTYKLPAGSEFGSSTFFTLTPVIVPADGRLYVSEWTPSSSDFTPQYQGAVVALGSDGQILPGWPHFFADTSPGELTVLADGGVGVITGAGATRLTADGATAP